MDTEYPSQEGQRSNALWLDRPPALLVQSLIPKYIQFSCSHCQRLGFQSLVLDFLVVKLRRIRAHGSVNLQTGEILQVVDSLRIVAHQLGEFIAILESLKLEVNLQIQVLLVVIEIHNQPGDIAEKRCHHWRRIAA